MDDTTDTPPARWVDTQPALDALVGELGDCSRLAIDTEFHRERTYWPHCALVQIGWGEGSALVDPLAVDIAPLAQLLTGRTIVMHAAGQDLEVFLRDLGAVPDDLFDTQIAASFLGMSSIGLAPLVQKVLDVKLPKADRLTDWLVRPLGSDAKTYAQSDVTHLFALHDWLIGELEQRHRLGWVADECREFVARAVAPTDADTLWWRIKEARRLRGRAAAIAQEVAKWRDAQAAASDRPVRSVLPDLALAGIAQRPPANVDQLLKIRGLRDRGLAKDVRAGLLEAVARGHALAEDAIRYPESRPVPSELRAAMPLLSAFVSERSRELALDPAVVATRTDLEAFLRGDESRLSGGWRAEAVAAELDELLSGQACLSFERGVGLVFRRSCNGSSETSGAAPEE